MQTRPLFALLPLAVAVSACGGEEIAGPDICAEAAAHVSACFPDQAAPSACDAGSAERILALDCDQLASVDGKADNSWTCLWTPWLCSAPAPTGRTLEISVNECARDAFGLADCSAVYSAPCALVTLHDGDTEIARSYTNTNGRSTFEGLAERPYTVRVLDRSGETTPELVGLVSPEAQPAKRTLTPEEGAWVDFYLPPESGGAVQACSDVDGTLTVYDADGAEADRQEVEWSWFVILDTADGERHITRPFAHLVDPWNDTETRTNTFAFRHLYPGLHAVTFQRMDIPSYARRNNPDYEKLLRWYAVDGEKETVELALDVDDVPADIAFEHALTEPAAD
jgi:hypothetical protein